MVSTCGIIRMTLPPNTMVEIVDKMVAVSGGGLRSSLAHGFSPYHVVGRIYDRVRVVVAGHRQQLPIL